MSAVTQLVTQPTALAAGPARQLGRWRRLPLKAKVGAIMLGLFALIAIIGPFVAPYNPSFQNPNPALSLAAPSAAHWLGTTQAGEDVLSQLLTGIRLTLELGLLVGVIATALSVLVGVTAALPRRVLGRAADADQQRIPGHSRAAAAHRLARLSAAHWADRDDPGASRTRLALGRTGHPSADAVDPGP